MIKKIIKFITIFFIAIISIILIIVAIGMYKFNYLQDDIYIKNINNEVVRIKSDEKFNLAMTKLSVQNYQAAQNILEKALKIDKNNLTAEYWIIFCNFSQKNHDIVIKKGPQLIKKIKNKKISADFIINTETLLGLSLVKLNKQKESNMYFYNALKNIENELTKKRNLGYIMNKSTLLCYLNQKEKALTYIKSIKFTEKELAFFGNQSPQEIIEQIKLTDILRNI